MSFPASAAVSTVIVGALGRLAGLLESIFVCMRYPKTLTSIERCKGVLKHKEETREEKRSQDILGTGRVGK